MVRLTWLPAILLGYVLAGSAPALAQKRVALVVGIDSYANLPTLQKAGNDARAVGVELDRLGFKVIYGRNLGRQGLVDKIAEFTAQLEAGDTALFFYAGHGVAIGGVNFLVPADAPAASAGTEARVRGASIAESDVTAEIQAKGVRVAVLVLDACRDNPFPRSGTRTLGNTRGLAEPKPARGVFTLYSAGIGQMALDSLGRNDPNPNSVFTRVFVEQLARPNVHLGELAVEVRERVAKVALTAENDQGEPNPHEQTPGYYDQTIGGRVYLGGFSGPAVPLPPPSEAQQVWAVIQNTTSIAVLEDFIRQFGATPFGSLARARLEELKKGEGSPPVPPGTPPRSATPLTTAQERSLSPKDSFKECNICPEMVVVPAGSFMMGSPETEASRASGEGPQRKVTIAGQFAAGRFAVTFAEWDACVSDGGCDGYKPPDQGWGRDVRPVINVTWKDARAYVTWLSHKTGKPYRLLSEAEREYITRAGTATPFWWGTSISTQQANYNANFTYADGLKGEWRRKTVPVETFSANPWGFYQINGNVWEWVEDCFQDTQKDAPTDGSARTGIECTHRVIRGGSWYSGPRSLRSASRFGGLPDRRIYDRGFRVARTLTP